MKRHAIVILVFAFAGCATSSIVVKEFDPKHVIHHRDLQKLESAAALSNYVVYLDKGDTFPLMVSLDTSIVGIADKGIDIVAKRRLFFMLQVPESLSREELAELEGMDGEKLSKMSVSDKMAFFSKFMLYVSKDAREWAPLNDMSAIKKALGSKGGTFSFGMGLSNEEGVWSNLTVKEVK